MKIIFEADYNIGDTIYVVRYGRIDKIEINSLEYYENDIIYHSGDRTDSVYASKNVFDKKDKAIDYLLLLKRKELENNG